MCNKSHYRAKWRKLTVDAMINLPQTRSEAATLDSEYYFTGKQCANGHIHVRIRKTKRCVLCGYDWSKIRKKNKIVKVFGMNVKIKEP